MMWELVGLLLKETVQDMFADLLHLLYVEDFWMSEFKN